MEQEMIKTMLEKAAEGGTFTAWLAAGVVGIWALYSNFKRWQRGERAEVKVDSGYAGILDRLEKEIHDLRVRADKDAEDCRRKANEQDVVISSLRERVAQLELCINKRVAAA